MSTIQPPPPPDDRPMGEIKGTPKAQEPFKPIVSQLPAPKQTKAADFRSNLEQLLGRSSGILLEKGVSNFHVAGPNPIFSKAECEKALKSLDQVVERLNKALEGIDLNTVDIALAQKLTTELRIAVDFVLEKSDNR